MLQNSFGETNAILYAQTPHSLGRHFEEKKDPSIDRSGSLELDFSCIHPFRDGNGRVSTRLLCHSALELVNLNSRKKEKLQAES